MEPAIEIVHVITETQLIDSESCQHTLGTTHVNRLSPGSYVVQWPSAAVMSRYDDNADFIGPFETRHGAELAFTAMDSVFPPRGASLV